MKKPSEQNSEYFRPEKQRFFVRSDKDLVEIRAFGRRLASDIGFSINDQTLIATAISELCRNVIEYAGAGEVTIETIQKKSRGIVITAKDHGPGIENTEQVLQEGYSTGKGMGLGLPGSKRIMDEFEISSKLGEGTVVRVCKWLTNHEF